MTSRRSTSSGRRRRSSSSRKGVGQWTTAVDDATGEVYFYNIATRRSTWTEPQELRAKAIGSSGATGTPPENPPSQPPQVEPASPPPMKQDESMASIPPPPPPLSEREPSDQSMTPPPPDTAPPPPPPADSVASPRPAEGSGGAAAPERRSSTEQARALTEQPHRTGVLEVREAKSRRYRDMIVTLEGPFVLCRGDANPDSPVVKYPLDTTTITWANKSEAKREYAIQLKGKKCNVFLSSHDQNEMIEWMNELRVARRFFMSFGN